MKLAVVLAISLLFASAALVPTASAEVGCGDGSVVNRAQYCANQGIDYAQWLAEKVFCDLVCDTPLLP